VSANVEKDADRKPDVSPDVLPSLDLRVGRVVAAVPFPAARIPSLRLTVDFGPAVGLLETSARIAHYRPEELVGRDVIGAINLGTRRIAGFDSRFLVLGAYAEDGSVSLLTPDTALPPGSIVG